MSEDNRPGKCPKCQSACTFDGCAHCGTGKWRTCADRLIEALDAEVAKARAEVERLNAEVSEMAALSVIADERAKKAERRLSLADPGQYAAEVEHLRGALRFIRDRAADPRVVDVCKLALGDTTDHDACGGCEVCDRRFR